jgi:4'-phosphopantetheinyl transferase EntD
MSLLAPLLPSPVVVEELREDPTDLDLFPAEEAVVRAAVEKRRREFAAVRRCAREALARLGRAPVPILPGERGAPGWPPGIVGSMTHCPGYAAAALAPADGVAGLGVDAELHAPLPDGVLDLVSLPGERAWLVRLTDRNPGLCWDRLLFSAKEAVYKTWFPLMRCWLGFEQAEVDVDAEQQTFRAQLLIPGPVVDGSRQDWFVGRWAVRDGILVTAIVLHRNRPTGVPG